MTNAVWAGPLSTLRWVQLSAYAADGKPATYSKGHAGQWAWGVVRWGVGILYGPGIPGGSFRLLYRISGGLVTSIGP